jgi:hypothetical protein
MQPALARRLHIDQLSETPDDFRDHGLNHWSYQKAWTPEAYKLIPDRQTDRQIDSERERDDTYVCWTRERQAEQCWSWSGNPTSPHMLHSCIIISEPPPPLIQPWFSYVPHWSSMVPATYCRAAIPPICTVEPPRLLESISLLSPQ